jgi:hypothetical protein
MVGGAEAVHAIENPEVRIAGPGATFHGRDVFAPATGLLAVGEATLADLGPEVDPNSLVPMMLPLPKIEPPLIVGEAWWIDIYGNVETNIGPEEMELVGLRMGEEVEVRVGATWHLGRWVNTYAEVNPGELAVVVDSAGLISLSVRGGRADEYLSLTNGVSITLRTVE